MAAKQTSRRRSLSRQACWCAHRLHSTVARRLGGACCAAASATSACIPHDCSSRARTKVTMIHARYLDAFIESRLFGVSVAAPNRRLRGYEPEQRRSHPPRPSRHGQELRAWFADPKASGGASRSLTSTAARRIGGRWTSSCTTRRARRSTTRGPSRTTRSRSRPTAPR